MGRLKHMDFKIEATLCNLEIPHFYLASPSPAPVWVDGWMDG